MNKWIYVLFTFLFGMMLSCTNIDKESRQELNLGIKLSYENNPDAIIHFNKAIELKPDFAEAYQQRSKLYFSNNDKVKAMQDINKAIELNPGYGEAYKTRALFKDSQADRSGACIDFKKARELGVHNLDNYLKNCP